MVLTAERVQEMQERFPKLTTMVSGGRQVRHSNVYCKGCGAHPDETGHTLAFYYKVGGCTSSVSFCRECAQQVHNPEQSDREFHFRNVHFDESIF